MKNLFKSSGLFYAFITTVVFFCAHCSKDPAIPVVTFMTGNAVCVTAEGPERSVQVGDILKNGDRIRTDMGTEVTVQFGDNSVFMVMPNSEVALEKMQTQGKGSIFLQKGTVLNRLKKHLLKKQSWNVRTPSAYCAVRGTSFMVTVCFDSTLVAVSEGTVNARPSGSDTVTSVTAGNTAIITKNVKIRGITTVEKLKIKKISTTPILECPDQIKSEKLKEMETKYRQGQDELNKKIMEASPLKSLAHIRSEYGRIDVVTLYNGRVIRGIILSRGKYLKMLTPSGEKNIEYLQVKQTRVE